MTLPCRPQHGMVKPYDLCLTRDVKDINFHHHEVPFADLQAAGGHLTVVEDRLMHHKFCILDGRDMLTGSYNWTNKAAHANEENIVLTTDDPEQAQYFLREFGRLTGQPRYGARPSAWKPKTWLIPASAASLTAGSDQRLCPFRNRSSLRCPSFGPSAPTETWRRPAASGRRRPTSGRRSLPPPRFGQRP